MILCYCDNICIYIIIYIYHIISYVPHEYHKSYPLPKVALRLKPVASIFHRHVEHVELDEVEPLPSDALEVEEDHGGSAP